MIRAPVFPLRTVLFPGMQLPLRIFEPRYTDMVGHCLKHESPFAVCLIRAGSEVGSPALFCETGTLASICHWEQLPGGLLGIRATGGQRVRVVDSTVAADNLIWGHLEALATGPVQAVPKDLQALRGLLGAILAAGASPYRACYDAADDADWVGYRLAELLPLDTVVRQQLLELSDGDDRLRRIDARLRDAGWDGTAAPVAANAHARN